MSIADLLSRATPEARYYDYDRKIMEDYDNRINIYNDALKQYQSDYDVYKGKVDAHNELANAYNTRLQDYTKQAEDYNAAVQKYLERYQGGQGGPSFKDSGFYVEKPGEFNESAPIFKGGDEPTAPTDPGFKKQDVDAFIDEATARATRRGQTAATAFNVLSQGGNFATAPQVQGGAGVGTTPEFSFSATGFENGGEAVTESTERGPINLPGFDNINFLLRGLNLPYNLVAGTGRKTREALDPSLPTEERIRAGGEAAIETGIQAFLPFAGRMAGQPLSRAVVESFFPVSTPKSTTELAADTVEDMGRRNMLKGAAATTGIAALAPEVFIEASKKVPAAVTKTAARAAINPVNMAAANIKILRQQRDEALEIINDAPIDISPLDASAQKIIKDAQYTAKSSRFEISDEAAEAMKELDPSDFKTADNDSLEDLTSVYFNEDVSFDSLDVNAFSGNMKVLADEIKKRGMDKAKDKNGIDQFPFARSFVEDIGETYLDAPATGAIPNPGLKMTDDSGKSTEQLIKELEERAFKSQYDFKKKELEMETDLSPEEIDRIARKNASRSGRNMAEGGVVSFAPYLR